jgi:hypothetical protein
MAAQQVAVSCCVTMLAVQLGRPALCSTAAVATTVTPCAVCKNVSCILTAVWLSCCTAEFMVCGTLSCMACCP